MHTPETPDQYAILVLPALQQSLRDFILFNNVDMCTPTRQAIPVHRIQQRL